MNMKNSILLCLMSVTFLFFGMQQPSQPVVKKLQDLFVNGDKDSRVIADMLWESLSEPVQLHAMLKLIREQAQPQLEHSITEELLKHADNIHTFLFDNVTVPLPVSMRWTRINHLFFLSEARYILGYVDPGKMLCWDMHTGLARACWQQNIPCEEGYNISSSHDSLVYKIQGTLMRSTGAAACSKTLALSDHESVYAGFGGRFVLVGPNLEKIKDLKDSERCYKILDFENHGRSIILPGPSYFNSITVSADEAFIIVHEERYDGQKRTIIQQLIVVASGQVFNVCDKGFQQVCGCLFSPSGRYLAVGLESSDVEIFDLTQGSSPRSIAKISSDEGAYINGQFLHNDTWLIEHISSVHGRSIHILDLKIGQSVYTGAVSQCIAAPQGKFVALMRGSEIALYDVARRVIIKNFSMLGPIDLCALSRDGKYLAVKEKDDDQCLSVYACASDSLLLRAPTDCNTFIFHEQEAYLIGMHIDEFNKTKLMCFWNVETGQYLGRWIADHMSDVYFKAGCPMAMVNYSMVPKSFLITRVEDIIKLDRMLCELAHIETALRLAVISNRNVLVEHTEQLLRFISDEYSQGRACTYGQYTASLLATLDRLVEYDTCLKWLESFSGTSSASDQMQCPARKRSKKERNIFEKDLFDVGGHQLKRSSGKTDFLESGLLQGNVNRFLSFCERLQQLAVLPAQDQKEISRKLCPVEIFRYIGLVRDELLTNLRCLHEGSWQYQAFRLILTWLPVCEKTLPGLITAYNRDRVVGFYNNAYPSDNSLHSLVAHKMREFIVCVQDGSESQIRHAKQELEVIYFKVVGAAFELNKVLPLLNIRKEVLSSCKAYHIRGDLLNKSDVLPPLECLQNLLDLSREFVRDKKSQGCLAPRWAVEELEQIENIVAIGDVKKLNKSQLISLMFLPTFKDFFDYCCSY